jgi:hypothetical protein
MSVNSSMEIARSVEVSMICPGVKGTAGAPEGSNAGVVCPPAQAATRMNAQVNTLPTAWFRNRLVIVFRQSVFPNTRPVARQDNPA